MRMKSAAGRMGRRRSTSPDPCLERIDRASIRVAGPKVIIRRPRPDEAAALADLGARVFLNTHHGAVPTADLASHACATFGVPCVRAQVENWAILTLVAEVRDSIEAYVQIRPSASPGHLRLRTGLEMVGPYARASQEGNLAADALLDAMLDAAGRAGYATLWLTMWSGDAPALDRLQGWGFTPIAETELTFGGTPAPGLVLARPVRRPRPISLVCLPRPAPDPVVRRAS